MTWRGSHHGDGPEPLPPEELLRIRRTLVHPPRPEAREHHIAAAVAEVRHSRTVGSAQALARRSARIIAGVAATIVVTSSLAGAEILVQPARAIFPTVSEHLLPHRSADQDPGDYVPVEPATDDEVEPDEPTSTRPKRAAPDPKARAAKEAVITTKAPEPAPATSSTTAPKKSSTSSSSTSSSTSTTEPELLPTTTTTEPDDSTTTTTEPDDSTTTTTEPDDSTTTTTEPNGSTTTTTTTAAPKVSAKAPPTYAQSPDG